MAGAMAAKRPPLPPHLVGAAADTGNIMGNAVKGPGGKPVVIPPRPGSTRPYVPPPPARRVTYNQDAARANPILRPPPPPPPIKPKPPPPLPDRQTPWGAGDLFASPQAKALFQEKKSGVKVLGEGPKVTDKDKKSPLNDMKNLPWGAVADTANIIQGTEKDPNKDKSKWKLAPNDNAKVEGDIWAGMGPDERADYTQLKAVMERGILVPDTDVFHDVERSLHNVIVQAQYRAYAAWAWEQQERGGQGPKGSEYGGFFDANVLGGGNQNLFTPNVILWFDGESGMYSMVSKLSATQQMLVDAKRDPALAGKLITAMLRSEIIPGATRKYAEQYLRFDADGNPVATWPTEYDELVGKMIDRIAADQNMAKAPDTFVDGAWESILRQGDQNQAVMDDPGLGDVAYGNDFGGGGGGGGGYGGYGGYGGGGGGGNVGSIFNTDPAAIGTMLDSISRARLGRVLTAEETAEFVTFYHSLETAYSNQYNARAGGVMVQPDLEGQVVAWIESKYGAEQAQETGGEFISALAAFLRGPGLGSGGSG